MRSWTEYNVFQYPSATGMQVGMDREGPASRFAFLTVIVKGNRPKVQYVRTIETATGGSILRTVRKFHRI